jgi:hypothetical protein
MTAALVAKRASESLINVKEMENRKPWRHKKVLMDQTVASQKSANGCNTFFADLVEGK